MPFCIVASAQNNFKFATSQVMFPDILLLENTFIQLYICTFTQSFFENNVKFFPCLTTESNLKPDKAIFTLQQYLVLAGI